MKLLKPILLLCFFLAPALATAQGKEQCLLDSLAERLPLAEDDSTRIRLLVKILQIHSAYKTDEGFRYEKQALALADATSIQSGKASLKNAIGKLYWRKGNFEAARRLHYEARDICAAQGDKASEAQSEIYLGQDYVDDNKSPEAIQHFQRAQQLYTEAGDFSGVARTYQFLAFVYYQQGKYAESAQQDFYALAAYEKAGDQKGIITARGNIANSYFSVGNYPEALKYFRLTNEALRQEGSHINRAHGYNNIGTIYATLKNYPEALANHDTALQIARAIGDDFCIAYSLKCIGGALNQQGKIAEALAHHQQAVKHFERASNQSSLVEVLAFVGICQLRLRQFAEARATLARAERLATKLSNSPSIIELHRGLEMLDSTAGDFAGAYRHFKRYIALRDSMHNEENTRKILHTQLQYDFEKRALVAKVEQERRDEHRRIMLAIGLGAALLFFGFFYFRLKIRRDRDRAEAKRLLDLSEAKSQFLNTVSHELRTPLTSILGFSKIIQKRLDERILPKTDLADEKTERAAEQVRQNLSIVVSESERLTALINEVLDLAKIESGKVAWHEEKISPNDLAQRAVAATATLFEGKNLALRCDIAPDLPTTLGDPDRLLQVLVNLLSNAAKFTERGTVTLAARLRDERTLLVSVADTGLGIAEAHHEQVFEKFKQVSSDTLSAKPQGTGLGLPICREIVEHHGGRIWLESALGRGSTFWFTLPVR